jgi:hypothetical protein
MPRKKVGLRHRKLPLRLKNKDRHQIMDFDADNLFDGRKLRMLKVVDC